MGENLKVLYIFTGGGPKSVNVKKWLQLFSAEDKIQPCFLLKEIDEEDKEKLLKAYPKYHFIFFKELKDLKKLNLVKRLQYFKKLAGQIENLKPAVIHVQGLFYTYMVYPLFFLKLKSPLIFNIWGSDFNLNYGRRLKNTMIIKWLFKKSALIWTNWFQLGLQLKAKFPQYQAKIRTIPWGVVDEIFLPADMEDIARLRQQFGLPDDHYIMLYTRNLVPNSNHLALIKAISKLDMQLKFKLIIHFTNNNRELENKLLDEINQSGLQNRVIISRRYLSDEEMKALYHLADLTFSLTGQEQFSQTIIEAIVSDCHLILNDNPAYRFLAEVFRFNIALVKVHDTEALAEKINFYVKQRPVVDYQYEKMVIQRLFRISQNKRDFLQIYRELADKRKGFQFE